MVLPNYIRFFRGIPFSKILGPLLAAAIGILLGLVVSVCEEAPSPNKNARLLHRNTVRQLDVWKELIYGKCVSIPYLFVTLSRLSRSISSLVGLCGGVKFS
jgi:predicted outer membrane lipoprotein